MDILPWIHISSRVFAFHQTSVALLALMKPTGTLCLLLVGYEFCNIPPIDGSNFPTSLHLPRHCTWEVQT